MSRSFSELIRRGLFVLTIALATTPALVAQEAKVDLDGNPANGEESRIETNVLGSFPVMVENVIFNNALGGAFRFEWTGAGPGGFDSILTEGPDVGTKWEWTTVSQVFTIEAPAMFVPDRAIPVFGAPLTGPQGAGGERMFLVPGKSIFPTMVTVSSASLTSSLVTFFSPEQTIATCESRFSPGRFEQTITNNTGADIVFTVAQDDCCLEPNQTICEDGCQSYLTDVNNCGGCGVQCAVGEFCDDGICAPDCLPGEILCDGLCVDPSGDNFNCGDCDNVCETGTTCEDGICEAICLGGGQLFCDGECVDIFDDEQNCGDCGIVCEVDEQCLVAVCTLLDPTPARTSEPRDLSRDAGEFRRRVQERSRRIAEVRASSVRAPESGAGRVAVFEAPICDIAPIVQTIADGESFTQCQDGPLAGIEVFTTATVVADGELVGQGPCAVIVPAPQTMIGPFTPSPLSVMLQDESGDGLLQPGESAEVFVEIANLGPEEFRNVTAVLSSAPDTFNTSDIELINESASFGDVPALPQGGDCTTEPVLAPRTNQVAFEFRLPQDQEADVGRVFKLNFQGDLPGGAATADMPFVLGIGDGCRLEDLDGETYDGVDGFLNPVSAQLRPVGSPVDFSSGGFSQGSNVPLKFILRCGSRRLTGADLETPPEIVGIMNTVTGSVPLTNINADNNANPNDPFFTCGTSRCEFGLRTEQLPIGSYLIQVEMPDTRVFQAGITID